MYTTALPIKAQRKHIAVHAKDQHKKTELFHYYKETWLDNGAIVKVPSEFIETRNRGTKATCRQGCNS